MLLPLLAAAVSAAPAETPVPTAAERPAQAVVRIVRGAEIRFGQVGHFEEGVVRKSVIRERDGSLRPASLIEFY